MSPQAYERGIALFRWPHVGDLWLTYLSKFVARYGGRKLERARDLFEQALDGCPPQHAKSRDMGTSGMGGHRGQGWDIRDREDSGDMGDTEDGGTWGTLETGQHGGTLRTGGHGTLEMGRHLGHQGQEGPWGQGGPGGHWGR